MHQETRRNTEERFVNITFIGMPGSGKSTVGYACAKALRYHFIDPDRVIENIHNKKLQDVVDTLGHEAFLDAEALVVQQIAQMVSRAVLSPGGSIIYREKTMHALKERSAAIIFLKVSEDVLQKRIAGVPRGITSNGKTFHDIFLERAPLYQTYATHTVDGEQPFRVVVEEALAHIRTA